MQGFARDLASTPKYVDLIMIEARIASKSEANVISTLIGCSKS